MTKQQLAIACALADLQGALQAYEQGDIHAHDWRAHQQSIEDLLGVFPFLSEADADIDDDTYDEWGVNTKNSFNTPPKGQTC